MKTKMFVGLLMSIALILLAGNVFAEEAYTFELTEGFSFAEETDISSIEISVPLVSGMADENDQILLNAHFLEKKDEIMAEYNRNIEMAKANYPEGNGPQFEYNYSWDVITDDDDLFVIWTKYFFAAGSAG